MTRITSTVFGILCALLLLWAVGCHDDDDKGTDPVQPKDYPVYIGDANLSRILIYHPIAKTLDTIVVPWSDGPYELTASADGSLLYAAGRNSVAMIDTTSFSIVRVLPYPPLSQVAVSPDGRFLAITGDDLHILSTGDYSVVYSDTVKSKNGVFSDDSRQFYCTTGWSLTMNGVTYMVKLSGFVHQSSIIRAPAADVLQTVPTSDKNKLLRYVVYGWNLCGFEVYDIEHDSVTFRDLVFPGYGEIAVSVDGKYAFYTNGGVQGFDHMLFPGIFTIFDIEDNAVHDTISGYSYAPSDCLAPPNRMAVTPDGRWLILLGGPETGPVGIYLFDLDTEKLVDYVNLCGSDAVLSSVTTQLMP